MIKSFIQSMIDKFDTEVYSVIDICTRYNVEDPTSVITDEQFQGRPFFRTEFAKTLSAVLEHWFSDGTLDEHQKETFRVCSEFLLKLSRTRSNTKQWLNQQAELIGLTEKCLNEIASYGYYIGIDDTEDPSVESFDWLLQAFENVACQQLLDTLVKCVTSRFYIDAFYRLTNVDALSLNITQHFLLVTCPNYILTCDHDKSYSSKITNQMLEQYDELFQTFLPHIKQWTIPVILCLGYPITFLLASVHSLPFGQKKQIYQVILVILLNKSAGTPQIEQVRTPLIYKSLCLLIEIIQSDKDLANELKNRDEKKSELIDILNDLSKNDPNEKIRIKALELVSMLVTEEEFLKDKNTEEVTGLFVKNFNDALVDGTPEKVDEILSGLKDLAQNDAVKQEIIKQNALPSILKYAKETNDNPLPLEITYNMTFDNEAKKKIKEDTEFVDHVKQLRSSEKKQVSQMAHGIIWKLEGEEKFQEKEAKKDEKAAEHPEKSTNAYDMMISYCWAQKELCHQINDRLEKAGYQVWLDRDEMHGSIIESMAEAIEQSQFVLLCMSSNYKKSINCKAEAEYAFNRKSKIIPLVVEPNYRADGWLGFLAGSKIYVDFADKKGEDFDKAFDLLMAELERNGLNSAEKDPQVTTSAPTTTEKKLEPQEEPAKPLVQTREYLNIGPAAQWTEIHVKEFLVDHRLEQFLPVCESMDGETLIEFHHSCQSLPDQIYRLVNDPKEGHPVSLGNFFKFISKLKKYLPVVSPPKIKFQYNYTYPSSTAPGTDNNP